MSLRGGNDIDWRYFVAGGICAATSHGITTPIDVVKTKMQTSPEKYKDGVISAAKDIIKTEGTSPTYCNNPLPPTYRPARYQCEYMEMIVLIVLTMSSHYTCLAVIASTPISLFLGFYLFQALCFYLLVWVLPSSDMVSREHSNLVSTKHSKCFSVH